MPKSVMVIDDEYLHRKLFGSWLSAAGYDVHLVEDEREAEVMIDRSRPNVVVLDLRLPNIHGLDLIGRIKSNANICRIPIVVVTVLDNRDAEESCLAAGAAAYMQKPAGMVSFLRAVDGAHASGSMFCAR